MTDFKSLSKQLSRFYEETLEYKTVSMQEFICSKPHGEEFGEYLTKMDEEAAKFDWKETKKLFPRVKTFSQYIDRLIAFRATLGITTKPREKPSESRGGLSCSCDPCENVKQHLTEL